MATFLVSGGAGFIGSALVDELCRSGARVRVLDDFSTGKRSNLAAAEGKFELFEGDVCDPSLSARAADGVDYVIHAAAVASVPRSVEQPLEANRINATGTLTLLEAARRAGVRRLVYIGSSSAYGRSRVLPSAESSAPDPLSPYAASKLAGEHYALSHHASYGFETAVVRFFNIYGPRQDPSSQYAAVIPRFIEAVLAGRSPTVYDDGGQTRDFCFVDDAVRATLLACEVPRAAGEVVNIASGRSVNLLEILDLLRSLTGKEIAPVFEAPRAGDIRDSAADVTRAKEVLGFTTNVSLEEGLRRTLKWASGAQS